MFRSNLEAYITNVRIKFNKGYVVSSVVSLNVVTF